MIANFAKVQFVQLMLLYTCTTTNAAAYTFNFYNMTCTLKKSGKYTLPPPVHAFYKKRVVTVISRMIKLAMGFTSTETAH